jgi:alpha/beta superfamily hydrolase
LTIRHFCKEKIELSLKISRGSNDSKNCFARQTIFIYRLSAFKAFLLNDCRYTIKNILGLRHCIGVVLDKGGKSKFECSILKNILYVKKKSIQHIVLKAQQMVKRVTFLSEDYELEGLFNIRDEKKGVVVTHPHPLYGGDMYNLVVESIVHVYYMKGYSTLKFNFRGVGGSRGVYDKGISEQKDVLSALSYLADEGMKRIDLAGYSFGAWVNAHVVQKDSMVNQMIMVSPPVGFMDFTSVSTMNSLKLVVTGNRDDIAPADTIKKMMTSWNANARFDIIDGADHFYGGYLDQLETCLSSNI